MVHNNDDAMNKIPLKSASGLDDDEKNAGEFLQDTAAAEEARREQMRANILKWMKKMTIVVICFIGIALICYVIFSLCFSDWPKSTYNTTTTTTTTTENTLLGITNTRTATTNQDPPPTPLPVQVLPTATVTAIPTILTAITSSTSSASSTSPSDSSLLSDDGGVKPNADATDAAATENATSDNGLQKAITATTAVQPPSVADSLRLSLEDSISLEPRFESPLAVYAKAAVVSDREVCSRIGSHMLAKNGTAVDAAIATLFCNGLLNLHSMGIGGGMLMNVYIQAEGRAYSIDARSVTPYAATPEMFDKMPNARNWSGLAINVPGEVMGYQRAHERFGKLAWHELLEPSLKLCKDGFKVSMHQAEAIKATSKDIKKDDMLKAMFFDSATGEPLGAGSKVKPPQQLCESYKLLAENGPMDFYNGSLAGLILEDLKDMGSKVTSYDFETYTADLVSSITMQLGNDTLHVMPPISSGSIVAHVLSILEGYNLSKEDMGEADKQSLTIHRFVEALKFAFAKRGELGDVRFNDVRELVSKLTNPDYGHEIRAFINDSGVYEDIASYGAEFLGTEDRGTAHISVLAPNGDAVSVSSSINDNFGSHQMGTRSGIVFNSGLYDFSFPRKQNIDKFNLPSSVSNYVDAHKRAMSSMSPILLTSPKGDVKVVLGATGGPKIISAITEVMARILWFGQDIKQAIDAPRFHHQLTPNEVQYEKGSLNEDILKVLEEKGHKLMLSLGAPSIAMGIVRNETAIYANADYRKRGSTYGF